MPQPRCVQCDTDETLFWKAIENGQICFECHIANSAREIKSEPGGSNQGGRKDDNAGCKIKKAATPARVSARGVRKSTRNTRLKAKTPAAVPPRPPAPRGRGRRNVLKRQPVKAPPPVSTVVTSDTVFHDGIYMEVGDIVSILDTDKSIYYAQIRGYLTDQYCEKSAVVTWLLPTKASPPSWTGFDPATYIIGPDEDSPRKLSSMTFVMHAPSNYYKARATPYPLTDKQLSDYSSYVWTTLEAIERL